MNTITKPFATAFILATLAAVSIGPAHSKAKSGLSLKSKQAIAVNLTSSRISRPALKSKIRRAALRKGVKLSRAQLNRATHRAMNQFNSNGKGPQKGKIHILLGKLEICLAWGKDKGTCG